MRLLHLRDRLWQSIQDSRNTTMAKFICALGIPSIGKSTAKNISHYVSIEDGCLKFNMQGDSIFTPSIVKNIKEYFSINSNVMEVSALIYELDFSREIQPVNDKLKNIKFCITGSFSIPRDKIREKLESCGAKFVNSVSSKTDILFCGNNAGSKLNKAKKLGIKVLNEDELIKKIQEGNW